MLKKSIPYFFYKASICQKKAPINTNINKKKDGFLLTDVLCGFFILLITTCLVNAIFYYNEKILQKELFFAKQYGIAQCTVQKIAYESFYGKQIKRDVSAAYLDHLIAKERILLTLVDGTVMSIDIICIPLTSVSDTCSILVMIPEESGV